MNDEPSLFDDPPVPATSLARHHDPDTSHAAAAQLSTGKTHCLALLRAHAADVGQLYGGYTDAEAAHAAGIDAPGVCWWHRCSDLRKLGLIEWSVVNGEPVKRRGPNGRDVRVSIITAAGRTELGYHEAVAS